MTAIGGPDPGAAVTVPDSAAAAGPGLAMATSLVCRGCGWRAGPDEPARLRCPAARPGDDVDHVVVRRLDPTRLTFPAGGEPNPFLRYRTLFHAYHAARRLGCGDADYAGMIERLDRALTIVDGHGFRVTPFGRAAGLSERLGFSAAGGAYVKDETRNVSGSHKARHLAGTLLELEVADATGTGECPDESGGPGLAGLDQSSRSAALAIASCGNAALAAAVVARAAGRPLEVFIPPDADPAVVARLSQLGARLNVCERRPGVPGDPTYARLLEAIDAGAVPFTCQGNLNGLAIEGGETLGLEVVDAALAAGLRLDRLFVQVGGGALASAIVAAFEDARLLGAPVELPRVHAVQTRGAFPLARAYRLVADRVLGGPAAKASDADFGAISSEDDLSALREAVAGAAGRDALAYAAHHRSEFMWPWEAEPHSVAHGILDDETYDWLAVVEGMLASGGYPVVVDEPTLEEANALGRESTAIDVDHTGSSGLAGLVDLVRRGAVGPDENVAVFFTGIRRGAAPTVTQPSAAARTDHS